MGKEDGDVTTVAMNKMASVDFKKPEEVHLLSPTVPAYRAVLQFLYCDLRCKRVINHHFGGNTQCVISDADIAVFPANQISQNIFYDYLRDALLSLDASDNDLNSITSSGGSCGGVVDARKRVADLVKKRVQPNTSAFLPGYASEDEKDTQVYGDSLSTARISSRAISPPLSEPSSPFPEEEENRLAQGDATEQHHGLQYHYNYCRGVCDAYEADMNGNVLAFALGYADASSSAVNMMVTRKTHVYGNNLNCLVSFFPAAYDSGRCFYLRDHHHYGEDATLKSNNAYCCGIIASWKLAVQE